jgi:hypothetical protein
VARVRVLGLLFYAVNGWALNTKRRFENVNFMGQMAEKFLSFEILKYIALTHRYFRICFLAGHKAHRELLLFICKAFWFTNTSVSCRSSHRFAWPN